MAKSLVVITYNLHGINQGESLLRDFCRNDRPDVFFLQEHWLSSINMNRILNFSDDYHCISASSMESKISSGILRGRPYGGVAIMFSNDLSSRVSCIATSERYIIARFVNIVFINVYAPTTDKNNDQCSELQYMLSSISAELIATLQPDDIIIFGGDFNTDMRKNSNIAQLFNDFIKDHELMFTICQVGCH